MVGLSKTCWDAGTALMAVNASCALPSSVTVSIDASQCQTDLHNKLKLPYAFQFDLISLRINTLLLPTLSSVTVSYIKVLRIMYSAVLSTATGTAMLSRRDYVNMSRR